MRVHTHSPPVFNLLCPSSFVRSSLQPHCLNKKLQRDKSFIPLQTHYSWIVFERVSDCTGTFELNHTQKGGVSLLLPEFLHAAISHVGNLLTRSHWRQFEATENLHSCHWQKWNQQTQSSAWPNAANPLVVLPIFIEDKVAWIIHHIAVASWSDKSR